MIIHMQHPDSRFRTLCGWIVNPNRVNSPVVSHGSKGANCPVCNRLYHAGQKVVDHEQL